MRKQKLVLMATAICAYMKVFQDMLSAYIRVKHGTNSGRVSRKGH